MTEAALARYYRMIVEAGAKLCRGKSWHWKVTFFGVAGSLFFSFPSYDHLLSGEGAGTWEPVLRQFSSPLTDMSDFYGSGTHASKKTYRLTVPVLGHLLGFGIPGAVLLQFLAGVLLLHLVSRISFELSDDRVTALFTTLAVALAYPGSVSFVELRGIFDGVALFFLAAAAFSKNPMAIGASVFLAAFTDERALIASPLILLFHASPFPSPRADAHRPFELRFFSKRTTAVLAAWIAYLLIRGYLMLVLGWRTATGGLGVEVLVDQINMYPMGLWTALEGGWLLVALALLALAQHKAHRFLFTYLALMLPTIVVAFSVFDITRSMAYLLPSLFIAVGVLSRVDRVEELRRYSVAAFAISLVWMGYYAGGSKTILWNYPLPLQILRWIIGGA